MLSFSALQSLIRIPHFWTNNAHPHYLELARSNANASNEFQKT